MAEKVGKLNPQITKVEIGVRELREVTIYPLSTHDQMEMTSLLVGTIAEVVQSTKEIDGKKATDIEIIEKVVDIIKDNLEEIIKLATDEKENVSTKDITNDQAVEIAEIIYMVNYENFSKNLKSLAGKMKGVLGVLRKQSSKLSGDFPVTE